MKQKSGSKVVRSTEVNKPKKVRISSGLRCGVNTADSWAPLKGMYLP